MTVAALSTIPSPAARRAASLTVLGDSIAVGLGDPLPAGGWRGFGALLAAALGTPGEVRYTNLAFTGARMRCLRHRQLPGALRESPDVAVILAGMNDTLRSDFDPIAVRDDLDATVTALQEVGTVVLTTRFHEHGRVFRLPGPLRRALHHRVGQLNDATEQVVARRGSLCLNLDLLPGAYDPPRMERGPAAPRRTRASDARAGFRRVTRRGRDRGATSGRPQLLRGSAGQRRAPSGVADRAGPALAGPTRRGSVAARRRTDTA
ncbi:MAG: SGNH/GDSL hydrolase family protein [Pseudonocardiaceae bacterium]